MAQHFHMTLLIPMALAVGLHRPAQADAAQSTNESLDKARGKQKRLVSLVDEKTLACPACRGSGRIDQKGAGDRRRSGSSSQAVSGSCRQCNGTGVSYSEANRLVKSIIDLVEGREDWAVCELLSETLAVLSRIDATTKLNARDGSSLREHRRILEKRIDTIRDATIGAYTEILSSKYRADILQCMTEVAERSTILASGARAAETDRLCSRALAVAVEMSREKMSSEEREHWEQCAAALQKARGAIGEAAMLAFRVATSRAEDFDCSAPAQTLLDLLSERSSQSLDSEHLVELYELCARLRTRRAESSLEQRHMVTRLQEAIWEAVAQQFVTHLSANTEGPATADLISLVKMLRAHTEPTAIDVSDMESYFKAADCVLAEQDALYALEKRLISTWRQAATAQAGARTQVLQEAITALGQTADVMNRSIKDPTDSNLKQQSEVALRESFERTTQAFDQSSKGEVLWSRLFKAYASSCCRRYGDLAARYHVIGIMKECALQAEPCGHCGGTGQIRRSQSEIDDLADAAVSGAMRGGGGTTVISYFKKCHNCVGTGKTWPPKTRKKAADAFLLWNAVPSEHTLLTRLIEQLETQEAPEVVWRENAQYATFVDSAHGVSFRYPANAKVQSWIQDKANDTYIIMTSPPSFKEGMRLSVFRYGFAGQSVPSPQLVSDSGVWDAIAEYFRLVSSVDDTMELKEDRSSLRKRESAREGKEVLEIQFLTEPLRDEQYSCGLLLLRIESAPSEWTFCTLFYHVISSQESDYRTKIAAVAESICVSKRSQLHMPTE